MTLKQIMIMISIQQEDTVIVNIYALNVRADIYIHICIYIYIYVQILTDIEGEIDSNRSRL